MAKSEAVVHPPGEGQPTHTRLKYYIDGEVLLEEFYHASDVLAATLIHDDRYQQGKGLGLSTGRGPLDRTIPVFILSLKNVPFDLAFENNGSTFRFTLKRSMSVSRIDGDESRNGDCFAISRRT